MFPDSERCRRRTQSGITTLLFAVMLLYIYIFFFLRGWFAVCEQSPRNGRRTKRNIYACALSGDLATAALVLESDFEATKPSE